MALLWHNHFATAYTKVSRNLNATEGARALGRQKPSEIRRRAAAQAVREDAVGILVRSSHQRERQRRHR